MGQRESDNIYRRITKSVSKHLLWDLVNLGQFDHINRMKTLSVITLSSLHCTNIKIKSSNCHLIVVGVLESICRFFLAETSEGSKDPRKKFFLVNWSVTVAIHFSCKQIKLERIVKTHVVGMFLEFHVFYDNLFHSRILTYYCKTTDNSFSIKRIAGPTKFSFLQIR